MQTIKSSKGLAVLLWAITLVVGFLDIYVSQFITISIYVQFFSGNATSVTASDIATTNTLRIVTVLIAAVLYLIFLVATSEYHFKHLAQPSSWRLLGRTIAVELFFIVVAYLMGPVTW